MPPRGMPGKGSASASTAASAPPPNYALPAAEGVPISDDWSRVHDRKEKKRMQNRVAQRTFRHRTRARIEELQTRLRYYELKGTGSQQANQSTGEDVEDEEEGETKDGDEAASSAPPPSSAAPSSGAGPTTIPTPPRSSAAAYVATDNTNNNTPAEHVALQKDYFGGAMAAGDSMMFGDSASDAMKTPSLSNPMDHDRNRYSRASARLSGISDGKVSEEAVPEILLFQKELLRKLNGPNYPAAIPALMADGARETLLSTMRNPLDMDLLANNGGGGGGAAAFMEYDTDGMDFAFSHPTASHWRPDMVPVSPTAMRDGFGHHPLRSPPILPDKRNGHAAMGPQVVNNDRSGSSLPPFATAGPASVVGWDMEYPNQHDPARQHPARQQAPAPPPHPQPPQQSQSPPPEFAEGGGVRNQHALLNIPKTPLSDSEPLLDTHFQTIMRAAESVGYANFDTLALSYYGGTFRENSHLAYEQRLSRNRRLPGVLSEIFRAAHDWTPWERRGLHDEILKTTETMLMRESVSMRKRIMPYFDAMCSGDDDSDQGAGKGAINDMANLVQNEQPNLWALIMALSAPDDRVSMWQQDRSRTALATILLTHVGGRVPKERLLSFIGAYL